MAKLTVADELTISLWHLEEAQRLALESADVEKSLTESL